MNLTYLKKPSHTSSVVQGSSLETNRDPIHCRQHKNKCHRLWTYMALSKLLGYSG